MNLCFVSDGRTCAAGWGSYKRSSLIAENSFYINDFDLSKEPWLKFEHQQITTLKDFSEGLYQKLKFELPVAQSWQVDDRSRFVAGFDLALKVLESDKAKKILLSVCDRAVSAGSLGGDPSKLPSNIFFYGFHLDGRGGWGTSPELLLNWSEKKKELSTMALAGTFEKKPEARMDPEHDEVLNFFTILGEKNKVNVKFSEREEVAFGDIKHLKTKVVFETAADLNHWIREMHPTPALGISPRNMETMKLLKKFREGLPGYFGAPIGYFGKWGEEASNLCKLAVMIRGNFFEGKKLSRPIGVGVTLASTADAEWNELKIKRNAMDRIWKAIT
jgi:isochorismate synthase EntC